MLKDSSTFQIFTYPFSLQEANKLWSSLFQLISLIMSEWVSLIFLRG